jgi:glycosyltransferase involved in cell wall biosynthesis
MPGRQDIRLARDRLIYEYGLKRVDRIFVQNPEQERLLREHYGRDSALIRNCFAAAPGAADPGGFILWIATLRPSKRPELVFEIARRMPKYRFVVIGGTDPDPVGHEYLRRAREAAESLPNLEYKGFLPFAEADKYFERARVLLNTSEYEGFPNTFLQAWSRGLPTVAFVDTGSRLDGQPVYPIAKDLNHACAAVERLMTDDAHWKSCATRARSFFDRHHAVDAVVEQFEREIAQLCARA